jgi:hypothetical protein
MIKIRVFFLMFFAVCSINAQKIEYVSLDSLNKIYIKNYNLAPKVSPESFFKVIKLSKIYSPIKESKATSIPANQ